MWFIFLLVVTKISDIAGYFIGKTVGKRRLSKISPNKTVEGSLAGLLAAVFSAYLFHFIFPVQLVEALILGLIFGSLSQIGDLAESLLKRDAGVKDSNNLPGIGGVLDLLDSLVFTAPFLWIYLSYSIL